MSGDRVTSYFGLRTWTLPPGFGAAPEGPLLEGVDLGGPDMHASAVADRASCRAGCEARQGCLAYVYTNCSGAQNCLRPPGAVKWP